MHTAVRLTFLLPFIGLLLAGCELLGIENPAQIAAAREAEGRAVGSACRHSGRALEDCYFLNPRALKAAIFTGWRDMDSYMRENNLEIIDPVISRPDDVSRKNKAATVEATPVEKSPPAETPPAKNNGAKRSAVELPSPATVPALRGGGKIA
jgi:hypothetical protein